MALLGHRTDETLNLPKPLRGTVDVQYGKGNCRLSDVLYISDVPTSAYHAQRKIQNMCQQHQSIWQGWVLKV